MCTILWQNKRLSNLPVKITSRLSSCVQVHILSIQRLVPYWGCSSLFVFLFKIASVGESTLGNAGTWHLYDFLLVFTIWWIVWSNPWTSVHWSITAKSIVPLQQCPPQELFIQLLSSSRRGETSFFFFLSGKIFLYSISFFFSHSTKHSGSASVVGELPSTYLGRNSDLCLPSIALTVGSLS